MNPFSPNESGSFPRVNPCGNTQSRQLPRYQVVLHHNSIHDLMYVVRTVMELTRFCRAEATHTMWEAHHRGQSVLLVTYLERAELYVEQFANRDITVSVHPA